MQLSGETHYQNTFSFLFNTHNESLYKPNENPKAGFVQLFYQAIGTPIKTLKSVTFNFSALKQQVIVCLPCLRNQQSWGAQLPGCYVISGPRLSRGWLTNPSTICAKRGCQLRSPQGKLASITVCVEVPSQSAVAAAARINWGPETPFGGLTWSSERATEMYYL